ncbi:TPA: hypothetical protein DIV55_02420 [Patescibacteria group bacterium]|nr:hypothetical protein [Patescibacteria group bacterium]
MTNLQQIFSDTSGNPTFHKSLLTKYPTVSINPNIQGGWPVIKGTRVTTIDIFRAIIKGHSPESIILQFKEMGVSLNKDQLDNAFRFSLEWLYFLHAKREKKATK